MVFMYPVTAKQCDNNNAKIAKNRGATKQKRQKNVLNAPFETFSTYLDTYCYMKCYLTQSFVTLTEPIFYLIISTLLFKNASREAPFSIPFCNKARSMS